MRQTTEGKKYDGWCLGRVNKRTGTMVWLVGTTCYNKKDAYHNGGNVLSSTEHWLRTNKWLPHKIRLVQVANGVNA